MNLLHRLTTWLSPRAGDHSSELGFPCFKCGQPATGWSVLDGERSGKQVINGYAACAAHQSRSGDLPQRKAG